MEQFTYKQVNLTGGFLAAKEELNRKVTIRAVYDRFDETGRIGAFRFDDRRVHYFWDSDVAKWMEGAAYILAKHSEPELERKMEWLIDRIAEHQGEDGYFNIYFTVKEPEKRFTARECHELYCAGHLFEAAVAYADATGRTRFLHCMEKYADYIYRVFVEEKSAGFATPGHEEIELALVKLYRYTGKKKYLTLAAHFINERGCSPKEEHSYHDQNHLPVREQTDAVGHSVRAVYLYSAMADLAKELGDEALKRACETLYADITERKMYATGGIGSCHLGETFSKPYDLPNEEAYTETCAGIGLMFFCQRMLSLSNASTYADTIERVLYNGVLSGLSLDGRAFFYENPLEITMLDHFENRYGKRRFPITQRKESFSCSCCPPNLNRLLPKLSEYIYGMEDGTLYINQFAACTLDADSVHCVMTTDYPTSGKISVKAEGVQKIAIRIPAWCEAYTLDQPHVVENGYAVFSNDGEATMELDMTPFAIRANTKVVKDVGKLCIQAGPVLYCAESVDNGENLHALAVSADFSSEVRYEPTLGLNVLELDAFRYGETDGGLYHRAKTSALMWKPVKLRMIPYQAFANRGETDMLVWLHEKC